MMLLSLIVFVGAYLLGSLNFSILLLRARGHGDPRQQASGNAGTVNTARIAGRGTAGVVLVLDIARAALVWYVATRLCPPVWVPAAALFLVLGNRFPLWHGLRGGKGVAALLGFVAAANPLFAILACVAWVATYAMVRIPAAGSMAMVLLLAAGITLETPLHLVSVTATVLTTTLIVLGHLPNWQAQRARK